MTDFILLARELFKDGRLSQRELSGLSLMSLGMVNKVLKSAVENGLILKEDDKLSLTKKGEEELEKAKVDRAVIFAAGFGSRFVPLTFETPKGLLKVYDERMIERQIKQLHEVGVRDITIVVGYLKEKFDYLIDKYEVKLLYNPEYSRKNTISTLWYAKDLFYDSNTYLLSSDNWIRNNMFNTYEPASWYSSVYMEGRSGEWGLKYNKKGIITDVSIGAEDSYVMYGPVYMDREFSKEFLPILEEYYNKEGTDNFYWENVFIEALKRKKSFKSPMYINKQGSDNVYEFENLEELRQFDEKYNRSSDNEAMRLISEIFKVPEAKICNLRCLKAGMTNKSFLFDVDDNSYICRIPGKGTDKLINRKSEYNNYNAIRGMNISEEIIYFNADNGYKIAKYYEGSHNANPQSEEEIKACLKVLHKLHEASLKVDHGFDLKERIEFYESLCEKSGGISFEDHEDVKLKMIKLYDKLERLGRKKILSHIDSVFDNFIFVKGRKEPVLIDWEYAAMSDPYIDVAMMAIYSYFDLEETNKLISLYFDGKEEEADRAVVYAYMALGGYLWALWAVYKSNLGESFGDYTLKMYRYAKDYYKYAFKIWKDKS